MNTLFFALVLSATQFSPAFAEQPATSLPKDVKPAAAEKIEAKPAPEAPKVMEAVVVQQTVPVVAEAPKVAVAADVSASDELSTLKLKRAELEIAKYGAFCEKQCSANAFDGCAESCVFDQALTDKDWVALNVQIQKMESKKTDVASKTDFEEFMN